MQTQEAYFLEHQVDGALSDLQTMQMLDLPQGDSSAAPAPQTSVPAADVADQPETNEAQAAADEDKAQQVILARDGVHTIPFEKLQQARQEGQYYRELAEQNQAELNALKQAQQQQPAPAMEPAASADTAELFGDFDEAGLKAGFEKLLASKVAALEAGFDARLAAATQPFARQQAEALQEAHYGSIKAAHPDVDLIVAGAELPAWIASKPSFMRGVLADLVDKGTNAEVIELLDTFKSETQPRPTGNSNSQAAQAAAQSAIAKAKFAPPTSLSEIPAGSAAHHDEFQAVQEMSGSALMAKFETMTAAQRNTLLSRI